MDIKSVLIEASTKAGKRTLEEFGKAQSVEFKGAIDIVTAMDKEAESIIIAEIRDNFPDHCIVTEESDLEENDSNLRWIIDPIDGTTNYAHGFPMYCVSIGFEKDGVVEEGVVYLPYLNEMFYAKRGEGAFLNDKKISVSTTSELDKSLVATGFPYDIRTSKDNNLNNFTRIVKEVRAVRRPGAAAIDICYVAAGRFDGFWETKLKPWDMAAAKVILEEAGGRISDYSGGDFDLYGTECLASNGLIHDELLGLLK